MILCPHNGTNLFTIATLTVDNLLISLHCQSICPSQYLRSAWMAKWIKNKETFFRYHSSEPVRYSVHQRFRSRFLWHKKTESNTNKPKKKNKNDQWMQNKAYNLGAQARDERKKTAIILKVTQCSKKCIWNPI